MLALRRHGSRTGADDRGGQTPLHFFHALELVRSYHHHRSVRMRLLSHDRRPLWPRGSPLQNLIAAGKTETKVSALRMSDEMDAGPVYDKRPMELAGRAEEIYLRAGKLCWEMIRRIIAVEPQAHPQSGEVTIFRRRRPEQSVLPTGGSLQKVYDHIRMLDAPTYPLAYVKHGEFHLALSHARVVGDEIHASVVIRHDNKTGSTNG